MTRCLLYTLSVLASLILFTPQLAGQTAPVCHRPFTLDVTRNICVYSSGGGTVQFCPSSTHRLGTNGSGEYICVPLSTDSGTETDDDNSDDNTNADKDGNDGDDSGTPTTPTTPPTNTPSADTPITANFKPGGTDDLGPYTTLRIPMKKIADSEGKEIIGTK